MKKIKTITLGSEKVASRPWYFLTHDRLYHVVAFTVDKTFMCSTIRKGLPVVAFEAISTHYPPNEVPLLLTLGYHRINGICRERHLAAKTQGYKFVCYLSNHACSWPDLHWGGQGLTYEQAIIRLLWILATTPSFEAEHL